MYTLLAEEPLIVSIMLGVCAGGLIYGWLQTGKKAALLVGLVTAILIPLAWVAAGKLVTDREQIEQLLYETADYVERNEYDRAYEIIGDADARARAESELPNFVFTVADINKIRSIDLIKGTYPPEADVDMSVKVSVSDKRGRIQDVRVVRRLILKFQQVNEKWVVVDYQHMSITGSDRVPMNLTQ